MDIMLSRDVEYCEKCGSKLIFEYKHIKFSKVDGESLAHKYGKCPKAKGFFNIHTSGWVYGMGRKILYG